MELEYIQTFIIWYWPLTSNSLNEETLYFLNSIYLKTSVRWPNKETITIIIKLIESPDKTLATLQVYTITLSIKFIYIHNYHNIYGFSIIVMSYVVELEWLEYDESLKSILIKNLLLLRADVRIGICRLRRWWTKYCWIISGGSSGRIKCLSLWMILLYRFSSSCAQIWASEGTDASRDPNETDQRRKASNRPWSAALA